MFFSPSVRFFVPPPPPQKKGFTRARSPVEAQSREIAAFFFVVRELPIAEGECSES